MGEGLGPKRGLGFLSGVLLICHPQYANTHGCDRSESFKLQDIAAVVFAPWTIYRPTSKVVYVPLPRLHLAAPLLRSWTTLKLLVIA